METFGGVYEVEATPYSPDETTEQTPDETTEQADAAPQAGAASQLAMAEGETRYTRVSELLDLESDGTTTQTVIFWLEEPNSMSVVGQLETAVADGQVQSDEQWGQLREQLVAQNATAGQQAQAPLAAAISAGGGTVVYQCGGYCLTATVSTPLLNELLLAFPQIVRVDPQPTAVDDAIWGTEMVAGSQLEQFSYRVDADTGLIYDGSGVHLYQIEPGFPQASHRGFLDRPGGPNRLTQRLQCFNTGCTVASTTVSGASHATQVAGLLMGDLTDGQDARIALASQRRMLSGYSHESLLRSYWVSNGTIAALDHLRANLQGPGPLLNMSASLLADNKPLDPECEGQDASSKASDRAFEAGIAFIKSASNFLHAEKPMDCQVGAPGSAVGVFTVGSHTFSQMRTHQLPGYRFHERADYGEANVRGDPLAVDSARGGVGDLNNPVSFNLNEGAGRSIISLTAFGCRLGLFDVSGNYSISNCGTSFATPTVTAFAADFQEFFRAEHGSLTRSASSA
jgi:hypothetical protein